MTEVAKDAIARHLQSLNPPAPAALISQIRNIYAFDGRAFQHSPPSPSDENWMRLIFQSCGGAGMFSIFSGRNMENAFAINSEWLPRGQNLAFFVCPAFLLNFDTVNPQAMMPIILHEIAHHFDPCAIGSRIMNRMDFSRCELPQTEEVQVLNQFFQVQNSFMDCLYDSSDMGSAQAGSCAGQQQSISRRQNHCRVAGSQVRRSTSTDAMAEVTDAYLNAIHPSWPQFHEAQCGARALRATSVQGGLGFWSMCPALQNDGGNHFNNLMRSGAVVPYIPHRTAAARQIQTMLRRQSARRLREAGFYQVVQAREAFADHVASQVLVQALQDERLGSVARSSLGQEERAADVITSFAGFCSFQTIPDDAHPHAHFRVSNFAGSASVRTAIGCVPISPPTLGRNPGAFPAAMCSMNR